MLRVAETEVAAARRWRARRSATGSATTARRACRAADPGILSSAASATSITTSPACSPASTPSVPDAYTALTSTGRSPAPSAGWSPIYISLVEPRLRLAREIRLARVTRDARSVGARGSSRLLFTLCSTESFHLRQVYVPLHCFTLFFLALFFLSFFRAYYGLSRWALMHNSENHTGNRRN